MNKIPDDTPEAIKWINYFLTTKTLNTVTYIVLGFLGLGFAAGNFYGAAKSLKDKTCDLVEGDSQKLLDADSKKSYNKQGRIQKKKQSESCADQNEAK